jgi:uncharacterized NAD(P)/FAD-binding protein YdhS
VAVVGGGAAGALAAVHLLAAGAPEVVVVDPAPHLGPGVAYGPTARATLLNVPAGRLGAIHGDPEGFLRWLRAAGEDAAPGDFLPRRRYGEYLSSVVEDAGRRCPGRLTHLPRRAVGLSGATLVLDDGGRLAADRIVLAPGAGSPAPLGHLDEPLRADRRHVGDPWRPGALEDLEDARRVLLVGTGLTAVDVATELVAARPEREIWAVSRHGLLPQPHRPCPPLPAGRPVPEPVECAVALVRAVRAHARAAVGRGEDWRAAVESLRDGTPALWRALPADQRAALLRHAAPFWQVHRHRMPPAVAARVAELRAAGVLRVSAGRLRAAGDAGRAIAVAVAPRGGGPPVRAEVDAIVNCTGPTGDLDLVADPLIRSLRRAGEIRPDPLRLGIDVDPDGRPLAAGRTSARLLVVGALRRGESWESTAIPEIRAQAHRVAELIAGARPAVAA